MKMAEHQTQIFMKSQLNHSALLLITMQIYLFKYFSFAQARCFIIAGMGAILERWLED